MYLPFYLKFRHFTETAKKKSKCKLPLPTVNQSLHTAVATQREKAQDWFLLH